MLFDDSVGYLLKYSRSYFACRTFWLETLLLSHSMVHVYSIGTWTHPWHHLTLNRNLFLYFMFLFNHFLLCHSFIPYLHLFLFYSVSPPSHSSIPALSSLLSITLSIPLSTPLSPSRSALWEQGQGAWRCTRRCTYDSRPYRGCRVPQSRGDWTELQCRIEGGYSCGPRTCKFHCSSLSLLLLFSCILLDFVHCFPVIWHDHFWILRSLD